MIQSFKDKTTEDVYNGINSKESRRFPKELHKLAFRKLDMLNASHELRDLRIPPANKLEALQGKLQGLHSIRINDQWRIVFEWKSGDAYDVQILDYHG